MSFKTVVIGLTALAGICVLAPGAASAMPNGLPHAEHLSNIDQVPLGL